MNRFFKKILTIKNILLLILFGFIGMGFLGTLKEGLRRSRKSRVPQQGQRQGEGHEQQQGIPSKDPDIIAKKKEEADEKAVRSVFADVGRWMKAKADNEESKGGKDAKITNPNTRTVGGTRTVGRSGGQTDGKDSIRVNIFVDDEGISTKMNPKQNGDLRGATVVS